MLQAMDDHQPAVVFLAYRTTRPANLFDERAVIDIRCAPVWW